MPNLAHDLRPAIRTLLKRPGFAMVLCRKLLWVYADSCGLKTAFLGNSGRKAATIFSLRYSSSR